MINTNVFINFCLDQSGSMLGVIPSTIQGYNDFIKEQREQRGEAYLSLTLFNTTFEERLVGVPLDKAHDLGSPMNDYRPGGGTALLDAVGTTIKRTEQWLKEHPEFQGKIVCAVLTDGMENSSHEWHITLPMTEGDDRDVAGLIQWKQTEGWEFIFLGSGGSERLEKTFGHVVAKDRFYGYKNDNASTSQTYAGISRNLTTARATGGLWTPPQQ